MKTLAMSPLIFLDFFLQLGRLGAYNPLLEVRRGQAVHCVALQIATSTIRNTRTRRAPLLAAEFKSKADHFLAVQSFEKHWGPTDWHAPIADQLFFCCAA